MSTYKHSGTMGDIIYALPVVKATGGGKFYLHMNQINWVSAHYYKARPWPYHEGKMDDKDFDFMKDFMLDQSYITAFEKLDTKTHEISHNLDRFRTVFNGPPHNYVNCFATTFRIPQDQWTDLRNTQWITTTPLTVAGRDICVSRTDRYIPQPGQQSAKWNEWKNTGWDDRAFFLGKPEEYELFKQITGWTSIQYQPIKSLKEMAGYIAGATEFIGNQSVGLSLAFGLGRTLWMESRPDIPLENNECYFPDRSGATYF